MSKLLTVAQVAEICGVTEKTVLNWIKAGDLKAKSLPSGRGVRIEEQALKLSLQDIDYEPKLDDIVIDQDEEFGPVMTAQKSHSELELCDEDEVTDAS